MSDLILGVFMIGLFGWTAWLLWKDHGDHDVS